MERRTRFDKAFDAVNVALMIALLIIILYPLYFTVIASFSDPYMLMRGEINFYPKGFTIEAYRNVFKNDEIWSGYANSVFYAGFGTLYALALTISTAYALSRDELPCRGLLLGIFMFTMYFSGGMIPGYVLVKQLGLLNTRWAIIIPAGLSVYNLIIARSFFVSTIPKEMYEAARIDGANEYHTFFRIVLPLSGAIIAVIALYVFVGHWNSYFSALLYLNDPEMFPLQLILRSVLLQNQQLKMVTSLSMDTKQLEALERQSMMAEAMKYALIFISSLPVLIAYPFVQKYFVKGVMIGAIKG